MKLLKIEVTNFLLCEDNFTIDFTPKTSKSVEDIEYELSEIDTNLYTFNTIGIVGKNASGKTTAIKLLNLVYDILSNFKIKDNLDSIVSSKKDVKLKIYFYYEQQIYLYKTDLIYNNNANYVSFNHEEIFSKKYYKTKTNSIFNEADFTKINIIKDLPDDTSIIYYILKDMFFRGLSYNSNCEFISYLDGILNLYKSYDPTYDLVNAVISLLDDHIKSIELKNNKKIVVIYKDNHKAEKNKDELFNILSSGTIKGLDLYARIWFSLKYGCDMIIDEIENHFHKTLVDNLINLYKDKRINKYHATLIFTTHYSEILDLFNRTDNIYISKYNDFISLQNMHDYKLRSDAIKSKKFQENTFDTAVNYDSLMKLKQVLMK